MSTQSTNGSYPIFLDLSGRDVLVVGGGSVAHGRVLGLLAAGARITLVAPEVTEQLREIAGEGTLTWIEREFDDVDVAGQALVFTATGVSDVDGRVAAIARERGIFVNSADDLGRCDFHVPAIARDGDIVVAVGTGGASPALAAGLRNRFAASLAPEWARLAELLGRVRILAQQRIPDRGQRRQLLTALAEDNALLAALARGEHMDAEALLQQDAADMQTADASRDVLPNEPSKGTPSEPLAATPTHTSTNARVTLVGAGPGAPELLTVRAYERIREADVVVYDDLVDRGVLASAPAHAELLYAGKRGWRENDSRPGPELLVQRAQEAGGKHVVRLKGGDPNIFGRSTEEIAALEAAGIAYEVVPGVTAALAAAAAAHIPLTERGVAGSVTLATGVSLGADAASAGEPTPSDIASLVRSGSTVVVYMGLRVLPRIAEALVGAGVSADLSVAVVGSASQPGEVVVKATLGQIAEEVSRTAVPSPAVVIIGSVAR